MQTLFRRSTRSSKVFEHLLEAIADAGEQLVVEPGERFIAIVVAATAARRDRFPATVWCNGCEADLAAIEPVDGPVPRAAHGSRSMALPGNMMVPSTHRAFMTITTVPSYPKGDLRRMLVVLAAIDRPGGATLVQIVAKTGVDKKTVTRLVEQAGQQAGVSIAKNGAVYCISDWGPLFRRAGAKLVLTGALGAPTMEPAEEPIEAPRKTVRTRTRTRTPSARSGR